MSKIEEYKSELIRVQEICILDTIDLVERANSEDKGTKTGRGNAAWLYKSSFQCLGIAARIEQLLEARNKTQSITTTEEDENAQKAVAEKLLLAAKKELTKRKGKTKQDGKEA